MEPPMAGHSIPIIHINVMKEKIRLEGKCSFVSFLCLFPYAHAHSLFFLSLCTPTRFVFGRKIYSFLSFVMPTHTILFVGYHD